MRTTALWLMLSFFVAFGVILALVYSDDFRRPVADEFIYIEIADDLNASGTFTNGPFPAANSADGEYVPGRFFAPAYPAFLGLASLIDSSTGDVISCLTQAGPNGAEACSDMPLSLVLLQSALIAAQMACVFAMALALSGSLPVAWIAGGIALAFSETGAYATSYLTENLAFFGFYIFLAAGTWAMRTGRAWQFALAGLGLGIAALSRPSYAYLFYVLIVIFFIAVVSRADRQRIGWPQFAAFVAVCFTVLAPWMARNAVQFGDVALSAGYGGFILVQRVAYNAMSWAEWGAAFIYWLPDFGDSLGEAIFAPETYARLGFVAPETFYQVGNKTLSRETLAAAGGLEHHAGYLLREYVLGDIVNHLLVTLPLAIRGIWAGKYLALAGVALLVPAGINLARRGLLVPFGFVVLTLFFMAGLHGFVSVNVVRYNIPMIGLYAFVSAYAFVDLLGRAGALGRRGSPFSPAGN